MTLQFPTIAEQVLDEFNNAKKTVSLATLAKKRKADKVTDFEGTTVYTFDDDTSLIVKGRGKSYRVSAELP
jgi:predicted lipoprotein with Yx(FWY)xxD motif